MKKILVIFTLLTTAMLLSSCGSSNNSEQEEVEEKITLIFATQETVEDTPSVVGAKAFAEKLYELSGGTIVVEFTQVIKFNSMEEMLNMVLSGDVDLVAAGYSNLDYIIEDLFILSQVTRDFDHFVKILESPFGQNLQSQFYEAGVVASNPWYMGTRYTTSNIPINELADFKKIKMRTVPTEAGQVFAKQMGAEIVPLIFPELSAALKNGMVNAQENPLSVIDVNKFYETQKYIAKTEHVISVTAVFLSRDKYDDFSIEQKAWYNEAINYGGDVCTAIVMQNEVSLLDKLVSEHGMTATYPNLAELRTAMKPHYDGLEKKYGSIISELISIE